MIDGFDFKLVIKEYWGKKIGLFLTIFITTLGLLVIKRFEFNFDFSNYIFFAFYIMFESILLTLWLQTKGFKKCPEDKIGIIFAINEQDEKKYGELKNKFINLIKNELSKTFYVQILPLHLCKFITDFDSAIEFSNRSKSHMVFYGYSVDGKRERKDKFELKLSCCVRHAPLNSEVQLEFQKDLSSLLPVVSIDKEDDLTQFEVNSEWFSAYATFFIAIAALLSQDYDSAEDILENLKRQLKNTISRSEAVNTIKKRIDLQLFEIYRIKHIYMYHTKYRMERKVEFLDEAFRYCLLMKELTPKSDDYFAFEALYAFLKSRNTILAKLLLNKLNFKNPVKNYSLAFIHAYEGNIEKSMGYYKKAFKLSQHEPLALEIEEFIHHILLEEPDKVHLYLCLSLINQFKSDSTSSRRDYERYLSCSNPDANIIAKYNFLIEEINKEINQSLDEVAVQ
jgi:hypothetical protein